MQTTPSKSIKEIIESIQNQPFPVGTSQIDKTIRIKGEIEKQDDFPQNATAKALSVENVIELLHCCGCTRDHALNMLLKLSKGEIEPRENAKIDAIEFKKIIARELPKNIVSGRTTGKLEIQVID